MPNREVKLNQVLPKSIGQAIFIFQLLYLRLYQNTQLMGKQAKKPRKKAKFSLYLTKTLMEQVADQAREEERSVNFVVEKILEGHYA